MPVPKTFHALHSATGKRYIYRAFEGDANPFESGFTGPYVFVVLTLKRCSKLPDTFLGSMTLPHSLPLAEVRETIL